MAMAPSPTCDSAVSPCFHGCLAFLHRHLSPQSLPSCLLSPFLHSQQAALALGFLHNPCAPAPGCCSFQDTCVPIQGMYGCGKDCLILIPFRLPQISCFTLSRKCFSSEPHNCPDVGIGPQLQFPHLPREGSVLLTLLFSPRFFCPTELCMTLYILFQCLRTPVHSQLVFCKHFCV